MARPPESVTHNVKNVTYYSNNIQFKFLYQASNRRHDCFQFIRSNLLLHILEYKIRSLISSNYFSIVYYTDFA